MFRKCKTSLPLQGEEHMGIVAKKLGRLQLNYQNTAKNGMKDKEKTFLASFFAHAHKKSSVIRNGISIHFA